MKQVNQINISIVEKARAFAIAAHSAVGQRRKYSNEPYWKHCEEVASLASTCDSATDEMLAAAFLHDVIEDTSIGISVIEEEFGEVIGHYVWKLTEQTRPEDGNRAKRKSIERSRLADAPADVQTIKLADLISNTRSIVQYDPDFAKVYLNEKLLLLEVMTKGDRYLYAYAKELAEAGLASLKSNQTKEGKTQC